MKCRRNPAFFLFLLAYINPFQLRNNPNRLLTRLSTDERVGLEGTADARTLGATKDAAAQIVGQVDAAHAGWLAVGHSRQGRANRYYCAAGGTILAAVHFSVNWLTGESVNRLKV